MSQNQWQSISESELVFYSTRAALGVGVSFGIAEDLGQAALTLVESRIKPEHLISRALKRIDAGQSSLQCQMLREDGTICIQSHSDVALSALVAGTSGSDLLSTLPLPNTSWIEIANVDCPLLVIALVQSLNPEKSWRIEIIDKDGKWKQFNLVASNDRHSLATLRMMRLSQSKPIPAPTSVREIYVDRLVWEKIIKYFRRCLVTSDSESRKLGAGAGLVDND